nr:hypothetical protein Iba_chr11bCG16350 [Ipomoea batatas]
MSSSWEDVGVAVASMVLATFSMFDKPENVFLITFTGSQPPYLRLMMGYLMQQQEVDHFARRWQQQYQQIAYTNITAIEQKIANHQPPGIEDTASPSVSRSPPSYSSPHTHTPFSCHHRPSFPSSAPGQRPRGPPYSPTSVVCSRDTGSSSTSSPPSTLFSVVAPSPWLPRSRSGIFAQLLPRSIV